MYTINAVGNLIAVTCKTTGRVLYYSELVETSTVGVTLRHGHQTRFYSKAQLGIPKNTDPSTYMAPIIAAMSSTGSSGGGSNGGSSVDETLVPIVRDVSGETVTLAQVLATVGSGVGVASFDFALKPVGGDSSDGSTQSTTSEASSTGPIGDRNLDPAGRWFIGDTKDTQGAFVRIDTAQSFTAAAGSIAILTVQVIV